MIHNPRNYFDQDVMMGILHNIMEDALTYPGMHTGDAI